MSQSADRPSRRSCREPALQPGIHYYLDPLGRMVFTARYLLDRGYCCKSGCRHCPYGYVPSSGGVSSPPTESQPPPDSTPSNTDDPPSRQSGR